MGLLPKAACSIQEAFTEVYYFTPIPCWLFNFIPKPRLSLLASFIVSKKKFLIRPHDSFLLCLIYVFPLIGAVNDGLRHLNMCINKDVV